MNNSTYTAPFLFLTNDPSKRSTSKNRMKRFYSEVKQHSDYLKNGWNQSNPSNYSDREINMDIYRHTCRYEFAFDDFQKLFITGGISDTLRLRFALETIEEIYPQFSDEVDRLLSRISSKTTKVTPNVQLADAFKKAGDLCFKFEGFIQAPTDSEVMQLTPFIIKTMDKELELCKGEVFGA